MTTIITILLIAGLIALSIYLPVLRVRRAIGAVIRLFRKYDALDTANAKTIGELGLAPPSLLDRLVSLRDFRPQALQVLLQTRIVHATEDDKLYLSEKDLASSNLAGYKNKH